MKLTPIGVCGSFAGPSQAASCYLVQIPQENSTKPFNLLIDFGSGALSQLQRYLNPCEVDAILISHLHPDHFSDLSGLEVFLAYHPEQNSKKIELYAPTGLLHRMEVMRGTKGEIPDGAAKAAFIFHEIHPGNFALGPLEIEVHEVEHPILAYGFKIKSGEKSLAYTGDTDFCQGALNLAQDADLLLAEAGYIEGRDDHIKGVHLSGKRAGKLAQLAQVKRLLLTHIPPWTDKSIPLAEAKTEFSGPLELAEAGKSYEI